MKRLILALGLACAACAPHVRPVVEPVVADARTAVLPAPLSLQEQGGPPFRATGTIALVIAPADRQAAAPAVDALATLLRQAGQRVEVADTPPPGVPAVALGIGGAQPALASEGYDLTIASNAIDLRAADAAGLFYGVQTIRDLLPTAAEHAAVRYAHPRPLVLPALHMTDAPRYAWRGAMLDVARHFFRVEDVERYIDLLALLKMNRLHLHLSDDQGWRIQIASRPRLTGIGSTGSVGGGPGGFYTQEQYSEIVRYAAARFVTVIPEIDMPGHTTAALASYPELNTPGAAPVSVYPGVGVTPNALCATCDATYRFVDDVIGELARLT
ncbi:MAG TPA: family 20 glycosylhydrolase, partial [Vicinamibacterales bacterium]|nr:family 20 glycosylhydrolase [Vicinamibacterales bacterium]